MPQKQITDLDKTNETDEKEEIREFCLGGDMVVDIGLQSYTHVNNGNGDFVLCKIGAHEGSGYVVYGKKINNNWKAVFSGQENPSAEVANQNKIPHELYMYLPSSSDDVQNWKY